MGDLHMWATFAVIAATIVAFASERYSIEAISLASLVSLLVLFTLVPQDASRMMGGEAIDAADLLLGFANPALVTVLALMVLGQALFATDALERPARLMARLGGTSPARTILVLLVTALVTSAFLNNTPVVLMFIPIVTAIAAQRNFEASRALMPLSFVGILGGMTTLIGSSTNLLVAGTAERYGIDIGFFDFTGPGVVMAGVGLLFVLFVMPLLLGGKRGEDRRARASSGRQFLAQILIRDGHPLIGEKARAGLFPNLSDMTVRSIQRDGETLLPPFDEVALQGGDIVVVAATRNALTRALSLDLLNLPELPHEDRNPTRASNTLTRIAEEFALAEAVLAPGSRFAGRTVERSRIRATYGTMILGLQRRSGMARGAMRDVRLEAGDTLLVGGLPDDLERLRSSRDLLLLERSAALVPLRTHAPRAIATFLMVIGAAATGVMPIVAAALLGAFLAIATGCVSIKQAERAFDSQIFMMVGASLAAATALERTGGARAIADAVVMAMDGQTPLVVLSALFLTTAILTNILSNNATAVLFTPVAIGIAASLNLSPEPFVVCIIFAANCSFATPVGYQTNLLVLNPGGYRFSDYLRAGVPLMLLLWIVFTAIAPLFYAL